jgi:hypothetical protein
MFRISAWCLAFLVPVTAQADCYVRSAITNQASSKITRVADVQTLVVPISNTKHKCIVTYRALIDQEWVTMEGEHSDSKSVSEQELCRGAMDQGRSQILSRADGKKLSVETNMVCDDRPEIQVRTVKIGDKVLESEVRPHPNFPKPFVYRAAQCRWFIEPEHRGQDLYQRQGIICLSHGSEWRVVDKW